MTVIETILAGIVIATISSLVTVQLSLGRFRSEKWWEKKAEAYSNLIGAIHDAKAFSEETIEAGSKGKDLSGDDDKALRIRSKNAESDIYRAMDVGAFYLSDKAIARLRSYMKDCGESSNTTDWVMYITNDYEANKSCLADMIEIARNDLKVGGIGECFIDLRLVLAALTKKSCVLVRLAIEKLVTIKKEMLRSYGPLKGKSKK
jgi:hypothetical protein